MTGKDRINSTRFGDIPKPEHIPREPERITRADKAFFSWQVRRRIHLALHHGKLRQRDNSDNSQGALLATLEKSKLRPHAEA